MLDKIPRMNRIFSQDVGVALDYEPAEAPADSTNNTLIENFRSILRADASNFGVGSPRRGDRRRREPSLPIHLRLEYVVTKNPLVDFQDVTTI
jgi:hypothetical protein